MPNTSNSNRQAIVYEALVVAYAMSRLDERFLRQLGQSNWARAFKTIGMTLGVKPASLKNLRDEFDPMHPNSRRGWADRPMRPDRKRVAADFEGMPDDELIEIVRGILARNPTVMHDVIEPLVETSRRLANVAQRLRTGRLAEEFFLRECKAICGIEPRNIQDKREDAQGFDFGVRLQPNLRIEVKGLMERRGEIVFTDLEWLVAGQSRANYWVVVVGCLQQIPIAKVFHDPHEALTVRSTIEQVQRQSWRSSVTVA